MFDVSYYKRKHQEAKMESLCSHFRSVVSGVIDRRKLFFPLRWKNVLFKGDNGKEINYLLTHARMSINISNWQKLTVHFSWRWVAGFWAEWVTHGRITHAYSNIEVLSILSCWSLFPSHRVILHASLLD